MTQLYSNLVNYINNTTYLCLVLAVLCSLAFSRVRLASLHMASLLPVYSSCQAQQAFPLFIDHREQRRTNTWSENKESILLNGSDNFLVLPFLVRM